MKKYIPYRRERERKGENVGEEEEMIKRRGSLGFIGGGGRGEDARGRGKREVRDMSDRERGE